MHFKLEKKGPDECLEGSDWSRVLIVLMLRRCEACSVLLWCFHGLIYLARHPLKTGLQVFL
jgi:hypothetical protein